MQLNTADYAVFVTYCIAVLAVGFWVARKEKTSQDYFLASRRLPWYAIGFSLIATSISGPITALLSLRRTAWCTSCRTKG